MAKFAPEVRLTGLEGEQLGIVSLREALEKAEEAGVDLVEISPNAEPPVCRIMDYGKFLYERASLLRNRRKSKKLSRLRKLNSVLVQIKGDYQVKLRSLIRFLEEVIKPKSRCVSAVVRWRTSKSVWKCLIA